MADDDLDLFDMMSAAPTQEEPTVVPDMNATFDAVECMASYETSTTQITSRWTVAVSKRKHDTTPKEKYKGGHKNDTRRTLASAPNMSCMVMDNLCRGTHGTCRECRLQYAHMPGVETPAPSRGEVQHGISDPDTVFPFLEIGNDSSNTSESQIPLCRTFLARGLKHHVCENPGTLTSLQFVNTAVAHLASQTFRTRLDSLEKEMKRTPLQDYSAVPARVFVCRFVPPPPTAYNDLQNPAPPSAWEWVSQNVRFTTNMTPRALRSLITTGGPSVHGTSHSLLCNGIADDPRSNDAPQQLVMELIVFGNPPNNFDETRALVAFIGRTISAKMVQIFSDDVATVLTLVPEFRKHFGTSVVDRIVRFILNQVAVVFVNEHDISSSSVYDELISALAVSLHVNFNATLNDIVARMNLITSTGSSDRKCYCYFCNMYFSLLPTELKKAVPPTRFQCVQRPIFFRHELDDYMQITFGDPVVWICHWVMRGVTRIVTSDMLKLCRSVSLDFFHHGVREDHNAPRESVLTVVAHSDIEVLNFFLNLQQGVSVKSPLFIAEESRQLATSETHSPVVSTLHQLDHTTYSVLDRVLEHNVGNTEDLFLTNNPLPRTGFLVDVAPGTKKSVMTSFCYEALSRPAKHMLAIIFIRKLMHNCTFSVDFYSHVQLGSTTTCLAAKISTASASGTLVFPIKD